MYSAKVTPSLKKGSSLNLSDGISKEELELVKRVATDQDTAQRVTAISSIAIELYRVLVSSLLIIFVPQMCGSGTDDEHVCSFAENMESDGWVFYQATLVINFITLGTFCTMYYLEARRENYLINHFDVDPRLPTDNESIGKQIALVPQASRDKLFRIISHYRRFVYLALGMFCLNAVLSGIILSYYQLGSQTFSVFVTNILFMVTKMNDIHKIGSAEKNIFLSAYIKIKLQYNSLDPDKFDMTKSFDSDMGASKHPLSHVSDYERVYDDTITPVNDEGVTADGGPTGGGRRIIKRTNPEYTRGV